MDFHRLPNQFKLLHNFELCVHFNYDASGADSEMTDVAFVFYRLDTQQGRSNCVSRRPENSETKTKFRSVLDHPHVDLAVASIVFHCVNWYRLKLAPSYTKSDRVLGLQHVWVPTVFLYLNS